MTSGVSMLVVFEHLSKTIVFIVNNGHISNFQRHKVENHMDHNANTYELTLVFM